MFTTFRYTLRGYRGQILGWGLGVAALGAMIVRFYDVFMAERADFLQMVEAYPAEFLAFFGGDVATLVTPAGFLHMYGFSMVPLILGIFAVMVGSGLLASDEESGWLDLIIAHPVSRAGLFWGRVLALTAATAAILILSWLGFSILLGSSTMDITWGEMALPFVSVLAQTAVYTALALFLSIILPSRRLAASGAGLVVAASYVLASLSAMNDSLSTLAKLLPYEYFQGGEAIRGLDLAPLLGLLGVSAALVLLAWWRFERRDIRVAGEGGWQLCGRFRRGRARAAERTRVAGRPAGGPA